MRCWLVKSEPEVYAWADLVREGRTAWTGVRNHQARANLAAMAEGDGVLFYHSHACEIVGIARVARAAHPDPTAGPGQPWVCVELAPVEALARPVSLAAIKADPALAGEAIVRQGRLSVMPWTEAGWARVAALSAAL